jgi:hypothetical protein
MELDKNSNDKTLVLSLILVTYFVRQSKLGQPSTRLSYFDQ